MRKSIFLAISDREARLLSFFCIGNKLDPDYTAAMKQYEDLLNRKEKEVESALAL